MSSEPADGQELLEPQHLHYSSILFDLVSHGRELLMPAVLGFLGAASGSWFWGLIAVAAFGMAVVRTLFRYFTLRYRVAQGELALSQGWLFRTQRTVPLRRIQNVDLRQNVLHRLFGVAEVRIETASGTEAEAILRVLTAEQIAQLRSAIFGHMGGQPNVSPVIAPAEQTVEVGDLDRSVGMSTAVGETSTANASAVPADQPAVLLRIPLGWLLVAGLAGNRGWLMVGLVLGACFQFELHERFLPQRWERWLARWRWNWDELGENALWILALAVAALLLIKLLGMAWYVLRFAGYRLERVGDDLRVSAGLLSTYSASIPRQRIQFVSLHRPWVLGWFGFVSVRIETAGGTAGGDENSQENIARTWFVPVIPRRQAFQLLPHLRPGLSLEDGQLEWQRVSPRALRRLLRLGILVGVVITLGLGWWLGPWGYLLGGLAVIHQIWLAWARWRSWGYARTDVGVVFCSGILYRKQSYTFFDRIQTIHLGQTPFDRRWGMASLKVDTAAAGPADHRIHVRYLEAATAHREFRALQGVCAENRPQWRSCGPRYHAGSSDFAG